VPFSKNNRMNFMSSPNKTNKAKAIVGAGFLLTSLLLANPSQASLLYSVTSVEPSSNYYWSVGYNIDNAGLVTGMYSSDFSDGWTQHWFSSNGSTFTDLGQSFDWSSFGRTVNNAGQTTGYFQTASGEEHAFISNGSTKTDLGTLGGFFSWGTAINDAGQVVGGAYIAGDMAHYAFISNGSTMTSLGALAGDMVSVAYDINNAGQVVGTGLRPDFSTHDAFVIDNNIMLDLNTLLDSSGIGWTIRQAWSINDLGQITGQGSYNGHEQAMILTPVATSSVPTPAAFWMIGSGLLGLMRVNARKKVSA
jgi:probable HAF family extracellular repeat protein